MGDGDIITQADSAGDAELAAVVALPQVIVLNLNGTCFKIPRERLLSLPQNILFDLSTGMAQPAESEDEPDSVICVDFSPTCFKHVLDVLDDSDKDLEFIPLADFKVVSPDQGHVGAQDPEISEDEWDNDSIENAPWIEDRLLGIPEVLLQRPADILLREDLDYYVLSDPKQDWDTTVHLKNRIGENLTCGGNNMQVFNNLRNRDVMDSPEFHLMQMLVLAGVSTDECWGVRERKPNTSKILSMKFCALKIPTEEASEDTLVSLNKLVLFWRKPAKKCWWCQFEQENVKIHARRVWTLELCISGLAG